MKSLREKHEHGTTLFPFEWFDQKRDKDVYVVYAHWHPETEWIYVEYGTILVSVEGQDFQVNGHEFFAIEPNCVHYIYSVTACHYFTCVFRKEFLKFFYTDRISQQYLDPFIDNSLYIAGPVDVEHTPIKENFLNLLYEINKRSPGYELNVRLMLLHIFSYCIEKRYLCEGGGSSKAQKSIEVVLRYIKEHYSEKLSSSDLAELVQYNPQYFSRYFKEYAGFSPTEYINRYRIEQACHKLVTTDQSILEISGLCGFDSCSYFIKKFKIYKNISPSEFRHRLKNAYLEDFVE